MTDFGRLRVAVYARFSTDRQSATSCADQIAKAARFVRERGGEIDPTLVFRDEAISGAVRDRPGLMALVAACEADRVDVVVVEALDRLSRDTEDSAWIRRRLPRLIAMDNGIDTASEGAAFTADIFAAVAAQLRRDIGKKTLRGMRGKAEAGLATGRGAPLRLPVGQSRQRILDRHRGGAGRGRPGDVRRVRQRAVAGGGREDAQRARHRAAALEPCAEAERMGRVHGPLDPPQREVPGRVELRASQVEARPGYAPPRAGPAGRAAPHRAAARARDHRARRGRGRARALRADPAHLRPEGAARAQQQAAHVRALRDPAVRALRRADERRGRREEPPLLPLLGSAARRLLAPPLPPGGARPRAGHRQDPRDLRLRRRARAHPRERRRRDGHGGRAPPSAAASSRGRSSAGRRARAVSPSPSPTGMPRARSSGRSARFEKQLGPIAWRSSSSTRRRPALGRLPSRPRCSRASRGRWMGRRTSFASSSASCSDGQRLHVFQNADGSVVVRGALDLGVVLGAKTTNATAVSSGRATVHCGGRI